MNDAFPIAEPEAITPRAAEQMREAGSFFSTGEFNLTIMIFAFAVLAIAGLFLIMRSGHGSAFVLRIYVIMILVFGTLLLVSSSYTADQVAPVVGFFGTIAGYLLGKSDRGDDRKEGGDA